MIQGHKVVTAHEMRRIEGLAFAQGAEEIFFMEKAAEAIASCVEEYVSKKNISRFVSLLVGKGNNGGDAYATGVKLLEKGFSVRAWHLFSLDSCGPLCRKQGERFKEKGGEIQFVHAQEEISLGSQGVIVDGLVGTGFEGKAEGILARVIECANSSKLPILSIDIPSGLNGNTGEVGSVAIKADLTIYLGLPKMGFFIGSGWNCVGQLVYADFGLEKRFIEDAHPCAFLMRDKGLAEFFPPLKRTRHKYEAGYVLVIGGSQAMPGAATLSAFAALRSGAGIVRLFYPFGLETELAHAPLEIIKEGWDLRSMRRIAEECTRAKSVLIGPGMGRDRETEKMCKTVLEKLFLPCVLDADALYFFSEHPRWKLPKHSILTPHRGEMQRFFPYSFSSETDFFTACKNFSQTKEVTLVVKGAPTFIFSPQQPPLIVYGGDPGMATAGSGDVLSGMIASFLAQGMKEYFASALSVALHYAAGELAALEKTSYCMVASDILENLPKAFSFFLRDSL